MSVLEKDNMGPEAGPVVGRAEQHVPVLRRFSLGEQTGVVVALVALVLYMGITQPSFLTWSNITNIVASNSVILILALGATLVVISGGLDLSTAAAAAACGMTYGLALQVGAPAALAVAAPILFGLILGLINGFLINYARISFLVVTLGTTSVFASYALIVSGGTTITVFEEDGFQPVYSFVNGSVGVVPNLMILVVALVLLVGGVLRYTSFGRNLYAVGSNKEAARLNGINGQRTLLYVYVIAGLAAGLASIVQVGRLTAAAPGGDTTLLLNVIAAVLIGGIAVSGGSGGVVGTALGVLFLGVIQNGLTLSDVSSFWRGAVNGAILIAAVGVGSVRTYGWRLRGRK